MGPSPLARGRVAPVARAHRRRARRLGLLAAIFAGTAAGLAAGGCDGQQAAGVDPPNDRLFFPTGLALHPDFEAHPDILYVGNANSDLRFNGGSLQVYDLDRLWEVIDPDLRDLDENPRRRFLRQQILSPDTRKSEVRARVDAWNAAGPDARVPPPCRAAPGKNQVVECAAAGFLYPGLAPLHTGSFSTDLVGWVGRDGGSRLLMPVSGDPSVVWIDLREDGQGRPIDPHCGQARADRDPDDGIDESQCSARHKLTRLRNEPRGTRLPIEPYRLGVSLDPERIPLAYLTHTTQAPVTLIGLEGLTEIDAEGVLQTRGGAPAIVDIAGVSAQAGLPGGYGVAQRPCDPDQADNVPDLTAGCTRPLVSSSLRFARGVTQFTAFALTGGFADPETGRVDPERVRCRGSEGGAEGAAEIDCDPRLQVDLRYSPGGLANPLASRFSPALGAMAYSADGRELFVVQNTPGALLRIDTSVDERGAVRNFAAGQTEVCSEANELVLFEDADAGGRFGLVSCYLVGQVYIVDLDSFQAVAVVQVGTGPHHMVADPLRKVVYVANTLDATISVIDMNRNNATRFAEVGRLGLQQPFSGD